MSAAEARRVRTNMAANVIDECVNCLSGDDEGIRREIIEKLQAKWLCGSVEVLRRAIQHIQDDER